jgi:hypothetical protein
VAGVRRADDLGERDDARGAGDADGETERERRAPRAANGFAGAAVDAGRRATAVEGDFSSGAAFLGRGTGGFPHRRARRPGAGKLARDVG